MHSTFHSGEIFFKKRLGEVNLGNQESVILSEKTRQACIIFVMKLAKD